MPIQLLALNEGPSILLDKPIMLFGRHPECDVQLNSRKVSRRHCCIAQVNDYLVIRDLASTNGVRVNGDRVIEKELHSGDELLIGTFKYQICCDGPGAPLPTPKHHGGRATPISAAPILSKPIDQLLQEAVEPIPVKDDPSVAKPSRPPSLPPLAQRKNKSGDSSGIVPPGMSLVPPG